MKTPQKGISIDPEKEEIFAHFVSSFNHLRHLPTVLYGIGANTHYILKRIKDFNIVGLMDQENTGREIFGFPVLSLEQVAQSAKCIIIIARSAVIPIIYKRIASLAASHDIAIYDVGGNNLSAPHAILPSCPRGDYRNGEAELLCAIDGADVISFDIFSTLATRKVLRPENVFDMVEQSQSSRLGLAAPFKINRILAEQLAGEKCIAPTIDLIYEELARLIGLTKGQKQTLIEAEIEAELRLLTPREKMIDIFRYALSKGKTVYLISDMYFGKKVLSRILDAIGIAGYKDLLVSCEVGMTKRSGNLFRYFLDIAPDGIYLHVGDDPVADVEVPRRLGIRTFHVMSGYEMLVQSPFAHLLAIVRSSSDALALGLFVARAFNNPFALHEAEGRLLLSSEFDLGYLGYGAILTGFIRWTMEKVGLHAKAKILFGARDGYLIQKLYSQFVDTFDLKDVPEGIYFLTSRRAATVSSIRDRQDILTLLTRVPGNPTYAEVLETCFGVTGDSSDQRYTKRLDRENVADMVAFVLESERRILKNAQAERKAYRRYVRSLGVVASDELYFFDLITSGTIPHFLRNVLGKDPSCLCFIVSLPVKYTFAVEPHCYLGKASPYQRSWKFFATHFLTESILTSPFPEFTRMDDNGVPVYGHQDDSHKYFDRVKLTQDGIEAYFADFLSVVRSADFEPISVELVDEINGILCSENCIVNEELKASYIVNERYTFSPTMNPWDTIAKMT